MEKFKHKIAELLIRYPKSMLICLGIISIIALYPASNIKTNFNLEEFFPKEDPTLLTYQHVAELFGRDDNVFVIALETEKFTKELIDEIKEIQTELNSVSSVTKTASIWDLQKLSINSEGIESNPYLEKFSFDDAIASIQSNEQFKNTFLNSDLNLSILTVSIKPELNVYAHRKELISIIENTVAKSSFANSYFITGIPYFRTQYVDYLNLEIVLYIGLGSILIISLLWYLYRNLRDVVLPILVVWLTILFTVAIMVLTGGFFEIMSSTIAPILLCVGIGDSVHMLTKFNDSIISGLDRRSSLIEMIRTLGLATLLTSVTTAIGFGTLLVSNVMPMQRFGLYTAIGVIVAFIVTILFLPSFVWQFKRKKTVITTTSKIDIRLNSLLQAINNFVQIRYKSIVIYGLLIALVIGTGMSQLRINSKVFDDIGESSDLIKHVKEVGDKLNPPIQLSIIFNTKEIEGVYTADVHRQLFDLENFLSENYPQIKRIQSIRPLLEQLHTEFESPQKTFFDSDSLVSNYLFLLEISSGDSFSSFIDFDYKTIRLIGFMDDIGSYEVNKLRNKLENDLKTRYPNLDLSIAGTGILVADLAFNLVYSLNSSIYLALFFIGFFMFLLFRTPSLTFISILPNILPLVITAGIMGWAGIDIKPSTAVIFTITFGIAVDDTIHFLARYRIEKNKLQNAYEAIFTTVLKTGKAIIVTSLILLMGFGVLITSKFDSTLLMGTLTCLTIFTAVLYDLLFLPALLTWRFKSENATTLNQPKSDLILPDESPELNVEPQLQ